MSLRVSEIGHGCGWFTVADAGPVFAFDWPPFRARSVTYTIEPDIVHIVTTYRGSSDEPEAIYMERRLAETDGERVALHDALFVSEALNAQRRGFATEMLRRSIPYYARIGIRHVFIPLAVDAGRTVWPKFGFRPADIISTRFAQYVAHLHEEKTGEALRAAIPSDGPGLLELQGTYGLRVGRLALETFPNLTLQLDLADARTIDSLANRGIPIA